MSNAHNIDVLGFLVSHTSVSWLTAGTRGFPIPQQPVPPGRQLSASLPSVYTTAFTFSDGLFSECLVPSFIFHLAVRMTYQT